MFIVLFIWMKSVSVSVCVCVVVWCCMKRTRKRDGVGIDEEGFKINEKIALLGELREGMGTCVRERDGGEQR